MSSSALQETGIWREAGGALPFLPEGGWRGRFALALALAAALELGLLAYLSGREVILAPEPDNPHPMEVHAVTLPAPLPQLQAVPQVAAPDTAPPPPSPETTTPPQPMAPPQPQAEVAPPPPAPAEPPPPAAESAFFEPPPPPVVARQPLPPHPVKTARQEAPPPQPKTEEAKAEPAKPPPPPSAPASAGQNLTALQRYAADLRGRVQSHLEVPATMRGLDLSGDTEVAIALNPDGSLVSVALRKSSGVSAIDRLSLETVKRTGFAPFTPDMPHSSLTFILLVHVTS